MEHSVRINVEEHSPMAVVHLEGSLAQLEVYKFKAQIEKMISSGLRYIIFDLEKLSYIDSAGIGSFVQLRTALQQGAGVLYLAKPAHQHVIGALAGSQMGKVIPTYATVADARHEITEKFGLRDPSGTVQREKVDSEVLSLLRDISSRVARIEERLALAETRVPG